MTDTYRAGFIRLTAYGAGDTAPEAMMIRPQLIDAILPTPAGAVLRIVGGERIQVAETVDEVLDVIAPYRRGELTPLDAAALRVLGDFVEAPSPRLSRHFDRPFRELIRRDLIQSTGCRDDLGRWLYTATDAGRTAHAGSAAQAADAGEAVAA